MTRSMIALLLSLAFTGRAAAREDVDLPAAAAEPSGAPSPAPDVHVALQLNVLGALQFGLVPGVEVGGRHFSVTARYRAITTGALSSSTFADSADNEELDAGWSAGGAIRWYQARSGPLRDWFAGAAAEYAYVRTKDTTVDHQKYESWAMVTYAEGGYRWVWTHFFTEAGLMLGSSNDTKETWTSLDTGAATPGEKESAAFVMGSFQIGWIF